MLIRNVLAGVAVRDLSAAMRWYENIFERPADALPMPEVAEWRAEKGGWIQVFHDEARAGSSSVTLSVGDLDRTVDALKKKGIHATNRKDTKTVKTALISDPDGNRVVLAEPQTDGIAQ